MVSQFTQQQQLAPPQAHSPTLSPAQWAQLTQLIQNQPQQGYQLQVAPPSTSAYTSDGTMAAIDPALLQAQWLQYQQSQLSRSAIIPQYTPQYTPQAPQGEYLSSDTLTAISQFIEAANRASSAASDYINYLRSELRDVDKAYIKALQFSGAQDNLIEKFLFDRNFALQYARYAWTLNPVDDKFADDLSKAYLEIAALSPYQQSKQGQQLNPEYMGSPVSFDAQLNLNRSNQNSIPPLPNSNGSTSNGITMEQYLIAQQQGLVGAARAAAMQNPANLYASLFQ